MLKRLFKINLLFAFVACNAMELPEKNNNNGNCQNEKDIKLKLKQFNLDNPEEQIRVPSDNPICQLLIQDGRRQQLTKILKEKPEFINVSDSQGNTPIFIALKLIGDIANAVKILIREGADLSLKNKLDESVLMNAIRLRELDLALYLIENAEKLKIDLSFCNIHGFSALDYAQVFIGPDYPITKILESKLNSKYSTEKQLK